MTGAGTVQTAAGSGIATEPAAGSFDLSGSIIGGGGYVKRGAGAQIFSGPNTYTGATEIVTGGGTLEIATGGSIVGTSGITYSTATLSVTGGLIDTPGNLRTISNTAVLNLTSGTIMASAIDRTINTQYLSDFNWTGGTVHLLTDTAINGSTATAINRPFGPSLTLDDDMSLIVDGTLAAGDDLTIAGGSVTADDLTTGLTPIAFDTGSLRLRQDQVLDAARVAALDIATPLAADRGVTIDGTATIATPVTLVGGVFSVGAVVNPEALVLAGGVLSVTASDLTIDAATAVNATGGGGVGVSNGALVNNGQLNLIGAGAGASLASTNVAGAEINGINANFLFTEGLTNEGDISLINSSFSGDLTTTAGGKLTLAGSNSFVLSDVTLSDSSSVLIDVAGDQAGEFDTVSILGDAVVDGVLSVSLSGGFTPTAGQSFAVLTASGVTDAGLTLAGPAASQFDLLVTGTSVVLQAVGGLAGDYNNDGIVDGADYTAWRDGDAPDTSQAGYDLWVANFGATAAAQAVSTVPEPLSAWLALVAGVSLTTRRR